MTASWRDRLLARKVERAAEAEARAYEALRQTALTHPHRASRRQSPAPAGPYERKTGRGVWWERCAPAVDTPGEWVKVGEARSQSSATSTAYMLRVGRFRVAPGVWEFAARTDAAQGRFEVWARYSGADDAPRGEA